MNVRIDSRNIRELMLGRALVVLAGLLILASCVYVLYALASLVLAGALAGNWIMVIAGGILLYMFIGLLVVGCIIGVIIMIFGVAG